MTLDIDDTLLWATGRTPAVLITTRRDGSPQSSDVAFAVIDGEIVISVTGDRVKTANMRRDPRIIVHVTAPSEWVLCCLLGRSSSEPCHRRAGRPHGRPARAVLRGRSPEANTRTGTSTGRRWSPSDDSPFGSDRFAPWARSVSPDGPGAHCSFRPG